MIWFPIRRLQFTIRYCLVLLSIAAVSCSTFNAESISPPFLSFALLVVAIFGSLLLWRVRLKSSRTYALCQVNGAILFGLACLFFGCTFYSCAHAEGLFLTTQTHQYILDSGEGRVYVEWRPKPPNDGTDPYVVWSHRSLKYVHFPQQVPAKLSFTYEQFPGGQRRVAAPYWSLSLVSLLSFATIVGSLSPHSPSRRCPKS